MSNRGKAIWVSIGLIFIVVTLVFGIINSLQTTKGDFMFTFMAFISLVILVFISDGCKQYLWKDEYSNNGNFFGENPDIESQIPPTE